MLSILLLLLAWPGTWEALSNADDSKYADLIDLYSKQAIQDIPGKEKPVYLLRVGTM